MGVSAPERHACGQCGLEWPTHKAYIEHACEKTGVTPIEPQSMGVNYKTIQRGALDRGKEALKVKKAK